MAKDGLMEVHIIRYITETTILSMFDNLLIGVDTTNKIQSVILDIVAIFYIIPNKLLIDRLSEIGITNNAIYLLIFILLKNL